MAESLSWFKVEQRDRVLIVTVERDVSSLEQQLIEPDIRRLLDSLEREQPLDVVIDFGRVPFFGSIVLSALVRIWKRISRYDGKLTLCDVSDTEREILAITKLDKFWAIHATRAAALAECGG